MAVIKTVPRRITPFSTCKYNIFQTIQCTMIFTQDNGSALWSYDWSQNPLKSSLILAHSSLLLWLPKLPTFSNSTSYADLSMALLILLQRLHYCVTFHRPCLFRNFATSRRGPSKTGDAMCENPSSCFEMITLKDKEILLFLFWMGQAGMTKVVT